MNIHIETERENEHKYIDRERMNINIQTGRENEHKYIDRERMNINIQTERENEYKYINNHLFLFQLKKWLTARMHGVESFKISTERKN